MKKISEITTEEILRYLNEERKLSRIDPNENYTWTSNGDPWVCKECGSEEVQKSRYEWCEINTGITTTYCDDDSDTYCDVCEEHTSVCRKSDFVESDEEKDTED